uniref:Leucine-rich repeat-containing protein 58 n=1 Tax=Strigamia maritima TaxID=126957 RepID=T1IIH8_STRMM
MDLQLFKSTNSIDLSYLQLSVNLIEEQLVNLHQTENEQLVAEHVQALYLQHNLMIYLPLVVSHFQQLKFLDVSSNQLTEISDQLVHLSQLTTLIAKNNMLNDNALPKDFGMLENLEELNLSGNSFTTISPQILELTKLKGLLMGANQINHVPADIMKLQKLQVLYLGGNNLTEIPAEMGHLGDLQALILCQNQLQSLPSTISHLHQLRSLALHKNRLTTLPPEIVQLKGLAELSLRDNPLVVRFIRDMIYVPPTLLELSARTIKIKNIPYGQDELPKNLISYLQTAHHCLNPKCKGVYFDARVEHVKFVDFCGKYKIPLLQYLCSPRCKTQPAFYMSDSDCSEDDEEIPFSRLKKVLLG